MKDTKQNIEDGLSLKEEELIKEIASLVLEKKCKKKKRESKHGDDEEEDGQEPDETSDTPSIKLKESLSDEAYELSEAAFLRLPGHVIANELWAVERDLQTFVSSQKNGNDVNVKQLNRIIKDLQSIKKEVKKFNKPEDVPVSYQYKKESTDEGKMSEDGQETSDTPSVKLKESLSDEAYELKLFADNDSNLYSKSKVPIMKNLSKKFKKGNYNNTLAIKAWKPFVDKAAKAYGKEHGNNDGFKIFSPAVRKELAKEFADEWNIEMQAGNFHESVNEGKIKVGSIVKPNKGPHKGQDHEVIAMQGNGVYNITPINIHYTKIKYRLGAAGAKEKDLELVKESNEEADLLELNLSLDKFVDVAKGTKTKNKFFVFNNKGQVYHTAPTLDKAKNLQLNIKTIRTRWESPLYLI